MHTSPCTPSRGGAASGTAPPLLELLPLDELPLLEVVPLLLPDPLLLAPPSAVPLAMHTAPTHTRPALQSAVCAQDCPTSLELLGPVFVVVPHATETPIIASAVPTVTVQVAFTG
jgi:hypothetical protein